MLLFLRGFTLPYAVNTFFTTVEQAGKLSVLGKKEKKCGLQKAQNMDYKKQGVQFIG